MSEQLAALSDAYERIEDIRHWTQGDEAKNEFGKPTSPRSRRAVRWCAVGSAKRDGSPIETVLDDACLSLYGAITEEVNDFLFQSRRACHRAVLRCYALAAAMVEAEE